jgi:hypothetical protein
MNFLKSFESNYQIYINSIEPVDAGADKDKPMNFFDYVRNELRKKSIVLFSNTDNETILGRYKGDKDKMDWNETIVRSGRSLVFDIETHETLMISPAKSYMINDFKAKHTTFDNILVEDFPSGPMVNMYNHPRKGWQLSTRSYVGANNNFRSGDKSFRQLFEEGLKKTTGLTLEEFGANLDPVNTFSFVVTHPEYFDVARYAEPSIVLVEVRDRSQDHIIVASDPVKEYFESKNWTIKFPKRHQLTTWEMVDEFMKTQPSQEQGLVFRCGEERTKIRNNDFIVARKLLGNHSKMVDVFSENLQNKTVNDFLTYFPEKTNEFHHFSTIYHDICSATHAFYIAHNTRPTGQKIEFSEIPRPIQTSVWNIHKQYLESGTSSETRRPVKPNVVDSYYRNLSSIELANILSYWDILVQAQKANKDEQLNIMQPRRHPNAPPLKKYKFEKKQTKTTDYVAETTTL